MAALAWTPASWDLKAYLQVDFFQVRSLGWIETYGRSEPVEYVKSYSISYSTSCANWQDFKQDGAVKVCCNEGVVVILQTAANNVSM